MEKNQKASTSKEKTSSEKIKRDARIISQGIKEAHWILPDSQLPPIAPPEVTAKEIKRRRKSTSTDEE
jgi:hypothetical protein